MTTSYEDIHATNGEVIDLPSDGNTRKVSELVGAVNSSATIDVLQDYLVASIFPEQTSSVRLAVLVGKEEREAFHEWANSLFEKDKPTSSSSAAVPLT